jgi:serine/threonine-protein kinase HipA
MLEKIGGECAGALSFITAGEQYTQSANQYQELTNVSLANILRELPTKPLLAGDKDIRLSLAGVQDKLAVYIDGHQISIPLYNAPSTHILKPDFSHYDGVIFNEAFCLKLANKVGLSVAESEIRKCAEIDYLLVKRYDRIIVDTSKNIITRLHQEDFCQALGIPSTKKYQSEEGPSLKQCFDLLRTESSIPVVDLNNMLSAVIFNFLIGNCDAHGKNFSLLYKEEKLQLAPLYDLICTSHYKELTLKMSMKIGNEYQIDKVGIQDFDKLAEEIGFAKPEAHRRIKELIDAILSTIPTIEIHHRVQEEVAKLINTRCMHFNRQFEKR